MAWFRADVKDLRARKEIKKKAARARLDRVILAGALEEALDGVGYVQESGPERLDLKQKVYAELDRAAPRDAILASSTSTLDMTDIAKGLRGARRAVVAHPVNPPHVVPVVEVLGGAETDPKVIQRTIRFLREVGQTPVLMYKYARGFILNRMQAALVREAVDLVRSGVADVEAVDASIREGLGLRWALMGPFGVANTNADGGVKDYYARYGPAYQSLWDDLNTSVRFDPSLIDELHRQTEIMTSASLEAQRSWRDRLVLAIRELKAANPLPRSRRRRRTAKS
jgi:3-hydroxyacyl-CoA dehydrogenase